MNLEQEIAALKRIAEFHSKPLENSSELIQIWTWGDIFLNTFGPGLHGFKPHNQHRAINAVTSLIRLKIRQERFNFGTQLYFTGFINKSWIGVTYDTTIVVSIPPNSELVLEKLDSL